jgi:hypothetical protein
MKYFICRKPRSGASLDEHNRFVVEKYIRRKFVVNKNANDPLTLYKNGSYTLNTNETNSDNNKNNYSSQP